MPDIIVAKNEKKKEKEGEITQFNMIKIVPGSTLKQQNKHANTLCLGLLLHTRHLWHHYEANFFDRFQIFPSSRCCAQYLSRTDFQMIQSVNMLVDARLPFQKKKNMFWMSTICTWLHKVGSRGGTFQGYSAKLEIHHRKCCVIIITIIMNYSYCCFDLVSQ